MSGGVEREIKLRFASPNEARTGVQGLGAALRAPRRLQCDVLLDTADRRLASSGCALRVRADGARAVLTFKGPVRPGPLKVREEIETGADSAAALLDILAAMAFIPAFRYEKYREEYDLPGAVIAIDETPIGAFVEIEGDEAAIHTCAARLGRSPADYVTASYRTLFLAQGGRGDMTFDGSRQL